MKKLSIFTAIFAFGFMFATQTAFAFGDYSFSNTSYYNWTPQVTSQDNTGTYFTYKYNDDNNYNYASNYNYSGYTGQAYQNQNYNVNSFVGGYSYTPTTCEATITRNLSFGSTGTDVATVQDYLHDQDFLQATPNGYFGYGTKSAVMKFQSAYGISITGTVGPATRSVLNDLICGGDTGSYGRATSYLAPATISPVKEIPVTHVAQSVVNPFVTNTNVYSQVNSTPVVNTIPAFSTAYADPQPIGVYNPAVALYYQNQNERATLTVTTPGKKSLYKEGDAMTISWTTTNMNVVRYVVSLDNTSTGLVKQLGVFSPSQTSLTVTLSKDLLDGVCAGTSACAVENANSYRVNVIAYGTSVPNGEYSIKAYVDQLAIIRPYVAQSLSVTASKTPVNSGETINLYVSVPASTSIYSQYSSLYWRIRAICPTGAAILVNGQTCGTDSFAYQSNITVTPNITATLLNNSWGPQQVIFEATAYDFYGGRELGKATTQVVVNK